MDEHLYRVNIRVLPRVEALRLAKIPLWLKLYASVDYALMRARELAAPLSAVRLKPPPVFTRR